MFSMRLYHCVGKSYFLPSSHVEQPGWEVWVGGKRLREVYSWGYLVAVEWGHSFLLSYNRVMCHVTS